MTTALTGLAARLEALDREQTITRIWHQDHTVWSDDPTEITEPNRLGWLTVTREMRNELNRLRRLASRARADGFENVVLMGMGGSSLAPEVLAQGAPAGAGLKLRVLDTTVPSEILAIEHELDLSKTLFVVASKSGTTIETISQLAYFWERVPDGSRFIVITDPGSPLEALGKERGFRGVFLNPESIGGRYSALSFFGLVPAALVGIDLEGLLNAANSMQALCSAIGPAEENPGAWTGAVLAEAALSGRDKLTLILPDEVSGLGDWIEQLLAESTGKLGKGIIPVVHEAIGPPESYGNDRLFVAYGDWDGLDELEAAGHPVIRSPDINARDLGAEFFLWEFATAVAGAIMGINPFDQPDVQSAKDATTRVLERGSTEAPAASASLADVLASVQPGDYIAIQAFLPRRYGIVQALKQAQQALRDRYKVAVTVGFGPRYLHSTGQVHKGGPNTGVFLQLVDEDSVDAAIPGRDFGFRQLVHAQAQGDYEALVAAGRRVARTTLDDLAEAAK
jgi:glucose-6-phosphate isomerase